MPTDFSTPPTPEEMGQPADPWAPPTPQEIAAAGGDGPGPIGRALSWLSTPFPGMKPIIEANQKQLDAAVGDSGLQADSGDLRAGVHVALSGVPGYQGDTTAAKQRMQRFRDEHPALKWLLPLAAGMSQPQAIPVAAVQRLAGEAGPVTRALENIAIKSGRRTLYGGANGLSERFPVTDSSIRAANEAGAFKPLGTTEHAANVLSDALDEAGTLKGDVVAQMEAAGIRGPDAQNVAGVLRSKAEWLRKNTAGTNLPELYEKVAGDIESAAQADGRLAVSQAERIKTSLQKQAKYGRPEETLQNIERRKIAATLRSGIEDAAEADARSIGTPQLQDIRARLGDIKATQADAEHELRALGNAQRPNDPLMAIVRKRAGVTNANDALTPAGPLPPEPGPSALDTALQDANAAEMSRVAQDAVAQLIPAKQAYALLAPAAKAAEKGLSQATKRNAFSLRDTIMAAPAAAAHGAGAGAATALLTKALRTYGPSTTAWGAFKVAELSRNLSPAAKNLAEQLVLRGIPQEAAETIAAEMAGGSQ